jgi:hypothetical protein
MFVYISVIRWAEGLMCGRAMCDIFEKKKSFFWEREQRVMREIFLPLS